MVAIVNTRVDDIVTKGQKKISRLAGEQFCDYKAVNNVVTIRW